MFKAQLISDLGSGQTFVAEQRLGFLNQAQMDMLLGGFARQRFQHVGQIRCETCK